MAADSVPGTFGHAVEARLVGSRVLASALGDVEGDGCAGAFELVGQVGMTRWKGADDGVSQRHHVHGGHVDVESVVIELHTLLIDRASVPLQGFDIDPEL